MMFISTEQFIHDVLPGIMRGRSRYDVLLASYNALDSPVDLQSEESQELAITVRSGGARYAGQQPSRLIRSIKEGEQIVAGIGAAQHVVESSTESSERYDLAVVYLGLTGFDKALMYALGLRRHNVADKVVIVTCDCNKASKVQKLGRILDAGTLTAAIITSWCGGQDDFADLHDGIQGLWPQVRKA